LAFSANVFGTAITQLVANSGFEDGVTGWSGTTGDLNVRAPDAAHRGSYLAWMGGYGQAHSETLYQNVSIPADAHTVTFSFWVNIETDETTRTRAYDKLYVQVRSADGRVLKTLATYSNLDRTRGYVEKTFDVSRFAGQSVQVFLKVVEDNGKSSSFFLDDFALTAQ
jgi:bacillopeptidase F (M6 metalloprotease family)